MLFPMYHGWSTIDISTLCWKAVAWTVPMYLLTEATSGVLVPMYLASEKQLLLLACIVLGVFLCTMLTA
jgi:hypothetical protein